MCIVDFSLARDVTLQSGSTEEKMMVYGIVNSVTLNFPEIKAVKLLINGREPVSHFSHMDPTAFYKPNLNP